MVRKKSCVESRNSFSITRKNQSSHSNFVYVGLIVFIVAFFTMMVLDGNGLGYMTYEELVFNSPGASQFEEKTIGPEIFFSGGVIAGLGLLLLIYFYRLKK
ncbi:hypothetical protein HN604_04050 [archaeon]|jgi:hypothetical protein|nr:hypothetical protein [archaeon]MBT6182391.1 hypothetical protein [archaeon]MBT6606395.1 hypothetical protein [archaeon]MBT7251436.1 hypothetical protein [archaeon]MBT7661221.1 hypothetical protein [archaeon]